MNSRQAALVPLLLCHLLPITGAAAGTFIRTQNITTTAGNDVSLRCELLRDDTKVTQVNWDFCNHVHIAIHVNDFKVEGKVVEEFSGRVSLAKGYGITISDVNGNDTGLYCCVFNTFPHGKFTGKIYLQVLAKGFTSTREHYLWIFTALGILLVAGSAGIFCYKRKSRGVHSMIGILSPAKPANSMTPSSAPTVSAEEEADGQSQEYFNIILYKNVSTI